MALTMKGIAKLYCVAVLPVLACAEAGQTGARNEPLCIPDQTRCADAANASKASPRIIERCDFDGNWLPIAQCSANCVEGICDERECNDTSERRCVDETRYQTCIASVGGWSLPAACGDGQLCASAECRDVICVPNMVFCEGAEVRVCTGSGTASDLVENCGSGLICNGGTCIDACELAEGQESFVGCEYYAIDADNANATSFYDDDGGQFDVIVANTDASSPAFVTVEIRGEDGEFATLVEVEVAPSALEIVPLACTTTGICNEDPCAAGNAGPDRHIEDSALVVDAAFRVRSDRPIVAYQLTSDDRGGCASSSGASTLLPRHVLGTEHYALTLPGNPEEQRGWISIVASEDDTEVTVTPSAPTIAGENVPALGAGEPYIVRLDETDVLQIASAGDGDDLSGSFIVTSAPVAVFAGHE